MFHDVFGDPERFARVVRFSHNTRKSIAQTTKMAQVHLSLTDGGISHCIEHVGRFDQKRPESALYFSRSFDHLLSELLDLHRLQVPFPHSLQSDVPFNWLWNQLQPDVDQVQVQGTHGMSSSFSGAVPNGVSSISSLTAFLPSLAPAEVPHLELRYLVKLVPGSDGNGV